MRVNEFFFNMIKYIYVGPKVNIKIYGEINIHCHQSKEF